MGLVTTLAVLAVAVVLFGTGMIVTRQPVTPGRPRMVPWIGIQMVSVVVVVFTAIHLMTLMTGGSY
jgi:hypothetical protein